MRPHQQRSAAMCVMLHGSSHRPSFHWHQCCLQRQWAAVVNAAGQGKGGRPWRRPPSPSSLLRFGPSPMVSVLSAMAETGHEDPALFAAIARELRTPEAVSTLNCRWVGVGEQPRWRWGQGARAATLRWHRQWHMGSDTWAVAVAQRVMVAVAQAVEVAQRVMVAVAQAVEVAQRVMVAVAHGQWQWHSE